MGRKLKKTLRYCLRTVPKNVPANFREIVLTDNGEIGLETNVHKRREERERVLDPGGGVTPRVKTVLILI